MGYFATVYKAWKKNERERAESREVCYKLRRWRKRIMEKENVKVVDKTLFYKAHWVGSFLSRDQWERRDIITTCLYTIQAIKWDDQEYHFDWEEKHDSTADS